MIIIVPERDSIGKSTVCRVVGMLGMTVVEVEPHPESTEVPVATALDWGRAIGCTPSLKVSAEFKRSKLKSFGLTPLLKIKR